MKKLPIADCRLPIGNLLSRRSLARCCHDGDEFSRASRPRTGAVIGGNRSSTADNLLGDGASAGGGLGNGACERDDFQRKCFRAGFELNWVHEANLQAQSAIANRQSAISK